MTAVASPEPLTPANCDLRDFPHTPLFRSRLFGSSFHARATDAEWRAGVTLWLKSWDQVPAGSLPNDDIELARLAELARDVKLFKKLKDGALRGWLLCNDGRLYHPVVAEGVNNAIEHKVKQRAKTAKARIAALEKHLKDAQTQDDIDRITDEIEKIRQSVSQSLSQTLKQKPRERKAKGEEEGKGENYSAPIGAGGSPPPAPPPGKESKPKTPAELEKSRLWAWFKTAMVEQKTCPDLKDAGKLAGGVAAKYGSDVFLAALREGERMQPGNAHTYVIELCERSAGNRVPLGRPGAMSDEQLAAKNAEETAKAKAMYRERYGDAANDDDVIEAEATVVPENLAIGGSAA